MRTIFAVASLALFGAVTSGTATQTTTLATPSTEHLLSIAKTQRIVRLVARHDHIDLKDTHVEVNSLDLMSPFIPGYASYILIREATTPGPDETLHRYAVNRQTGDVWEMTLCTRYDFPALRQLQRSLTRRVATAAEIAAERQELGCTEPKSGRAPGNPAS
jgi:hypothetical protein